MSDLNELNEILFKSLKKVEAGEMDATQANSVIGISTAIINNGKLHLNAYKLANKAGFPQLMGLPTAEEKQIPASAASAQTLHATAPKSQENKDQDKMPFLTPHAKQALARKDRHAAMLAYAKEIGFKNTTEAIAKHTSRQFTKDFEAWLEEN